MFNFNKTYDILMEDIIQSVTSDELKERQHEYSKIKITPIFEKLKASKRAFYNSDGTYVIDIDVRLDALGISKIDFPVEISTVNGYFDASSNFLTTLEGMPKNINGNIYLFFNKLTNLKYCPTTVTNQFDCSWNYLTSLEGCPIATESDSSYKVNNNNLHSLHGLPSIIDGTLDCSSNPLTTLEGLPKKITGNLYINNITLRTSIAEIREVCDVGRTIFTFED